MQRAGSSIQKTTRRLDPVGGWVEYLSGAPSRRRIRRRGGRGIEGEEGPRDLGAGGESKSWGWGGREGRRREWRAGSPGVWYGRCPSWEGGSVQGRGRSRGRGRRRGFGAGERAGRRDACDATRLRFATDGVGVGRWGGVLCCVLRGRLPVGQASAGWQGD
jgi:hypothetical protein